MEVIDFHREDIITGVFTLSKKIRSSGFQPQLVLGVADGGSELSRFFAKEFSTTTIPAFPARGTFSSVKHFFLPILRLLPEKISNRLRIYEIERKRISGGNKKIRITEESIDLIKHCQSILIIDDAVDTGETLSAIISEVKRINPEIAIRSAVLTITKKNPLCQPDFTLFNDNILLRLKWKRKN